MTTTTTTARILDIPPEVTDLIISYIHSSASSSSPLSSSSSSPSSSTLPTISSLSRTCRTFHPVGQRWLFHTITLRQPYDPSQRAKRLLATLKENPELGRLVKGLVIDFFGDLAGGGSGGGPGGLVGLAGNGFGGMGVFGGGAGAGRRRQDRNRLLHTYVKRPIKSFISTCRIPFAPFPVFWQDKHTTPLSNLLAYMLPSPSLSSSSASLQSSASPTSQVTLQSLTLNAKRTSLDWTRLPTRVRDLFYRIRALPSLTDLRVVGFYWMDPGFIVPKDEALIKSQKLKRLRLRKVYFLPTSGANGGASMHSHIAPIPQASVNGGGVAGGGGHGGSGGTPYVPRCNLAPLLTYLQDLDIGRVQLFNTLVPPVPAVVAPHIQLPLPQGPNPSPSPSQELATTTKQVMKPGKLDCQSMQSVSFTFTACGWDVAPGWALIDGSRETLQTLHLEVICFPRKWPSPLSLAGLNNLRTLKLSAHRDEDSLLLLASFLATASDSGPDDYDDSCSSNVIGNMSSSRNGRGNGSWSGSGSGSSRLERIEIEVSWNVVNVLEADALFQPRKEGWRALDAVLADEVDGESFEEDALTSPLSSSLSSSSPSSSSPSSSSSSSSSSSLTFPSTSPSSPPSSYHPHFYASHDHDHNHNHQQKFPYLRKIDLTLIIHFYNGTVCSADMCDEFSWRDKIRQDFGERFLPRVSRRVRACRRRGGASNHYRGGSELELDVDLRMSAYWPIIPEHDIAVIHP